MSFPLPRLCAAIVLAGLSLSACGQSSRQEPEPPASVLNLVPVDADAPPETIIWRDLLPDEDLRMIEALSEGLADPSLMSRMTNESGITGQFGTFNVVEDLDQLVVRMPGYLLPLDFAEHGSAYEFLMLPYHGACVHTPPPPPNQIVYLRSPEPVRFGGLWEPVWVEGRMEIERVDTDLAATAYAMTVRSVEPYQP